MIYLVTPYNVAITGDNNTYSQGEQLELNCSLGGGPELEYFWLSGGKIANASMLTIANLTTSNGGDYTCYVRNDAAWV